MSEIPQDWALRLQLTAIAGNEPATSLFEIRSRRATGMQQVFVPLRELDRAATAIGNRAQTSDVFLGVCPRTRRCGRAEAVERVWCLWADVDDSEAVLRATSFRPQPSIEIRSGSGGAHFYWPLHKSIRAEWARLANRRLALALQADPRATDPARVLRPLSVGRAAPVGVSPACSFADASVTGVGAGDE